MKRQSTQPPKRFERRGVLAIAPSAILDMFVVPDSRDSDALLAGVAVIDVCGPLTHHSDYWSDSYDAIRARVRSALSNRECKSVVLRIDSPGGEASGCFEAARAIRADADAAGKPIHAFVDQACSAGYALACAANTVTLADTAIVGSIGVLATREDISAANAARGIRVALITSGARKADGHADAPITDTELVETQTIIDSMAGVFFQLVADLRGLPVAKVAALEARSFHGEAAIRAGLADDVMSFDGLLAAIASGAKGKAMANEFQKAREALQKAAEGDDANAEAAKRALAALGGGASETDDEVEPEADPDAAAAGAAAAADDDDTEAADAGAAGDAAASSEDAPADDAKPKKAAASAEAMALQAMAEVHKMRAEGAAEKIKLERRRLLDSRKDFAPELRASLMKPSTPIAIVRDMVKTLPKGPAIKPAAAAASTVAGVRGASQGTDAPDHAGAATVTDERSALARRMGLTATSLRCRKEPNALVFGVTDAIPANDKPDANSVARGAK
jgi:ClpP class serine protease